MKRLVPLIFSILLISSIFSSAQISPGAKQVSLSHSSVALSNDVFSLFTNPAGLSQMNWREVAVYYSPAPFGLSELANGFAAYHEPTEYGSFAAGFMFYGFELYKENKIALSYSNRFNKNFFAGLTVIYQSITIENYGSDHAFNLIAGGLTYILPDLRLAFSLENLLRSSYGDEKNQIPVLFATGASYDLFPYLSLNLSMLKELDHTASVRFGIDYMIIDYINLRFGVGSKPSSFAAGLGINYSMLEFDYAVFNHQDLGFTHQFGLLVYFGDDVPRYKRIHNFLDIK